MATHYKEIKNGNGTVVVINDNAYLKIGKNGIDIMLRANNKVYAFNSFEELVNAIDGEKAIYKAH